MNNEIVNKGIEHLIINDKQLSTIIKKFGKCNIHKHRNYLNALLSAIIGQQLSIKAAAKINERFNNYFGKKPDPNVIVATDNSIIQQLGLSKAKTQYVKDLCSKIIKKELSLVGMNSKTDEEVINALTKVKGIGLWTAQMFLIFTLGRLNVLASGDLGIRKGVMNLYNLSSLPSPEEVENISNNNNWNPYNTLACIYIWKYLDN